MHIKHSLYMYIKYLLCMYIKYFLCMYIKLDKRKIISKYKNEHWHHSEITLKHFLNGCKFTYYMN